MTIAKVIVFGVCSVAMLLSPLLRHRPKIQDDVRLVTSALICSIGVGMLEALLNISWGLSLLIILIYVVLLILLTKAIESKLSSAS
ncbi:MAG: hypothetical protein K2J63_01050 [Muribaculaceae bacterium]|nr:hypothetical protein [Muribaculaceae bacterium]